MTVNTAGMDRIRAGLPEAIERGIERGANMIADLARQLAPYDPKANHKHLNESIEVQDGPHALARRVVAGVGLPDPRAAIQEVEQPYMTPARRAIDVQAEVAAEVRKLVRG